MYSTQYNQLFTKLIFRCAFILFFIVINVGNATAQGNSFFADLQSFGDLLLPDGTQITIGIGPQLSPDYVGSDNYEVEPNLAFFVRVGNFLTLENDGSSFNILGVRDFEFGPVLRFTGGRNDSSNPDLAGLGDITGSLDLGVFARVNVADHFTARLRYFAAVAGGGNGGVLDLTLKKLLYQKDSLSIAMAARTSWATENRAQKFFGISAEQALNSGLPEFNTGSSLQDIRVSLGASWEFKKNWSLNGFTRYSRLLGDIADSPIVDTLGSSNQFTIGTYVAHTFQFD